MFAGSKIKVGAFLVLLTLLAFSLAGCTIFDGKKAEIQKNMTNYLRSTYGQEFVVEKPELMGNEGFGYKNYLADAYPEDQPDLKFSVKWDKSKPAIFEDNYLGTKWSKQGTEEMQRRLREVYGEDFWLDEYWISYNNKKDKNLEFQEIIKDNAGKIRVDIRYFVFIDEILDKKFESRKAYKILKENFIDLGMMQYNFSVVFVAKQNKASLEEVFKKTTEGDYERSTAALLKSGIAQDSTGTSYAIGISEKYNEKIINNEDDLISQFKS